MPLAGMMRLLLPLLANAVGVFLLVRWVRWAMSPPPPDLRADRRRVVRAAPRLRCFAVVSLSPLVAPAAYAAWTQPTPWRLVWTSASAVAVAIALRIVFEQWQIEDTGVVHRRWLSRPRRLAWKAVRTVNADGYTLRIAGSDGVVFRVPLVAQGRESLAAELLDQVDKGALSPEPEVRQVLEVLRNSARPQGAEERD